MNEIYSYSTKQAVDEGVLFKVEPGILEEIGIKFPVYLTSVVFRRYVEVPADARGHQELNARLFDLLYMFAQAAKQTNSAYMKYKFVCLLRQDATAMANESNSDLSLFHKEITLKEIGRAHV